MRTLHCGGYYSESLAFAREILHTKETAFPFVFDTCDMLSDVISPYYPNCFRDVLTEAGYISIALRAFESDTVRMRGKPFKNFFSSELFVRLDCLRFFVPLVV